LNFDTKTFLSVSFISLSLSLFVNCLKIKLTIADLYTTAYIIFVFIFIILSLLIWILNIVDYNNSIATTNTLSVIGILLYSLAIITNTVKEKYKL
jgi:hypothetical protein